MNSGDIYGTAVSSMGELTASLAHEVNQPIGTRELTVKSQRGENGQVLILVTDTGEGLPPEQPDKIFNAFFTTKTHGTGIGLRISRSIIESLGGHLWAADNSPRGATFQFTLPVTVTALAGSRAEPLHGTYLL